MNEVAKEIILIFEMNKVAQSTCELCKWVIGKENADTAVVGPNRTPVHKECWEKYVQTA